MELRIDKIFGSPDGQQIAFGMGGRIYTINVDGTDLKVLSFESTGGSSTVNWSPDNEVIAYYNQYRIYLIRPDGLEQHEIVLPGIGIYDMAWSPDAKRIAFIDRIGGDNYGTLYVIDRDGENFQQLTDKIVDDESGLDWSPDGEQIAFVTVNQTTGCQELSVYDMRSQSIAQIPNQTHIILKLDWSPDGDFIIFSGTEVSPCNSSEIKNEISMFIINMSDYSISPQLISSGAHDPAIWPTTRIHVGWSYRVTELGDNLNLREQAGTSATRLAQLDKGDIVLVLDGPQEVEAYQWWQVQTSDGLTGWVAEVPGWFVLESAEVEH